MDNNKLLGTIIAVLLLLGIGLLIGSLTSLMHTMPTQVDVIGSIMQESGYHAWQMPYS
ncbi:hypothetical protein KFZ56_01775 [Virgibacillus sp. NKC19-3]|uniref:hypothetical protein n=1 Tax=Virgibacillus saliphilus TaxID=2831674 RepID=UPI001C9B19BB|nr:hypothetical protein [Virgibacillus sp. NKC19-3]MBY7141837.1 hypothetical protein [Virgibacillus sp. NKC19-3]